MGCFGFIADILGFSIVRKGLKHHPWLTWIALCAFWGWAFITGMMVVRYAHLGEHPYVFEILPIASCLSPVVAMIGVLLFTIGDAFTNIFSEAFQNSFGFMPFDLYKMLGEPHPLLTWGAYVRLNLIGLMSYALLPGLLGRLFSRLLKGIFSAIMPKRKKPAAVYADGPKEFDADALPAEPGWSLAGQGPGPSMIDPPPGMKPGDIMVNMGPDQPGRIIRDGIVIQGEGLGTRVNIPGLAPAAGMADAGTATLPPDAPGSRPGDIMVNMGPDSPGQVIRDGVVISGEGVGSPVGLPGAAVPIDFTPVGQPVPGGVDAAWTQVVSTGPGVVEVASRTPLDGVVRGGPAPGAVAGDVLVNMGPGSQGQVIRDGVVIAGEGAGGVLRDGRDGTVGFDAAARTGLDNAVRGAEAISGHDATVVGGPGGHLATGHVSPAGPGGVLSQVAGINPTVTGLGTGHLPDMTQMTMGALVRAAQATRLAQLGQLAGQSQQGLAQASMQAMIRRRPRGPKPGWGHEPYRPQHPFLPDPEPPAYYPGPGGFSGGPGWHDMIPGYIGAVIGAAGGIGLGGGIYYGDMWAEYHPIRVMTHPSGTEDASCFKMDANYAVQNVAAGGTMSPVGGAAVAVSGATGGAPAGAGSGAGAGAGSGGAGTGKPAVPGEPPEELPGADGTVLGIINGAGAESLNAQQAAAQKELDDLIRNQGYDPDNPRSGQDIADAHQRALTNEQIARNNHNDAVANESRLQNEYQRTGDPATKAELDNARQARQQANDDLRTAREARQNVSDDMASQRGAREHLNKINNNINRLNNLNNAANMLLDFSNYLNKDGMSAPEAAITSFFGNTAAGLATAAIGTADFAAGVFFPQSLQGYTPGSLVKDSVKNATNAIKALASAAGGDEQALNAFGESSLKGDQGVISQGYAEIANVAGNLYEDPLSALGDFGQGIKEIWAAGPLSLAGDAINRFANDCITGKEGPMAQTVAEVANIAGDLTVDPAAKLQQVGSDVNTIIQHGNPSDIVFGDEGSQRATQILGPIGQGYAELGSTAGEIYEDPVGFAGDVKDTTIYVAGEAVDGIKNGVSGVWNWGRSFF